jgi:hypothetical protein
MWVNIGTPNLTDTGDATSVVAGSSAPNSENIVTVLSYVTWISGAIAVLSLIILAMIIATKLRAGEGIAAVGRIGLILASVVLISSASSLVGGLLPNGPTGTGGAVAFLQGSLWWYMLAAAVLSVIIGGVRMAWEQRAEPGRDTLKSLCTLIVVAGAGVTIIGLLVTAADSFAVWIINASLECDVGVSTCFGGNMATLLALTTRPAASGLGPLLIIILGIVAILATAVQIVLMVARGGMLVILTGILPLSASATNTEMGKSWFKKCISWLVAFILYKPAAALVYAAAFQLVGTNVFKDDGTGFLAVLTGLMLMIIALFAMPALMRFVTPLVGALAAGGAGGALAAGALGALPSGAASIARRVSDSGSSSSSGSNGSKGNAGPSGNSSTGQTSAGAGQQKSPGGSGATSAAKTSGGAAAGSAGGGAAAGGAAAGGGAAAAGAAAGPAGIAAGAALDVAKKGGQAAAGAARSAGEQATGEGDGPSGS